MAAEDRPQIYLITPPGLDLESFPDRLARVLDGVDVACLRFGLATSDADHIGRAADALRAVAHDRDVAVVAETHLQIAERHGLDGVHLTNGARNVRAARKALGSDAIVGAFCGTTRHEGMNAAEAGADYVSFGPCGASALGHGTPAELDLFQWWSEMIEAPVVAEGALTPALIGQLAPVSDFIALGPEIWSEPDPVEALGHLWR